MIYDCIQEAGWLELIALQPWVMMNWKNSLKSAEKVDRSFLF